eukprot:TCONS_00067936-protein
MFNSEDHPHLRLNLLTNEWVIVSPHRMKRPWAGQIEATEGENISRHDLKNPLCPGATRSSGMMNDDYKSTFVFENDFPALLKETPDPAEMENDSDLLQSKRAEGTCRVMCFHPYSDLSLPLMSTVEIQAVITEWINQYTELSKTYQWVQIFENKGKMMGCSNPHPHCQIWGCNFLPNEAIKQQENQLKYYNEKQSSLLLDYIKLEQQKKERIVVENDDWIVVIPYWAMWPFEILVMPKKATQRINDLSTSQQQSLSTIMKSYLTKYDNLFKTSFPYSMGWHSAPGLEDSPHWQLHAHYYPPLLRSATVKKHMVGFEMLSGAMRDITPEKAATTLRDLSDIHYKTT